MAYYLAKSEPSTYSIGDLRRDQYTVWDGVMNAQAVRAILAMRPGDKVFIYHSGGVSAVVGLATVRKGGIPDPKNPKSAVAELGFLAEFENPVTLTEIKQSHLFDDWSLVRQSRLSTMAAPDSFADWMRERFPKAGI